MNSVSIDPKYCKGCLRCKSVCPKDCLDLSGKANAGGYDYIHFVGEGRCIACGLCRLVCPDVAITMTKDS